MKKVLASVGLLVGAFIVILCLGALALWCYFLLTVLHWVALKVGFSDGLADLLVGVVVVFQSIPFLIAIVLAVIGAVDARDARKRRARRLHPVNRR